VKCPRKKLRKSEKKIRNLTTKKKRKAKPKGVGKSKKNLNRTGPGFETSKEHDNDGVLIAKRTGKNPVLKAGGVLAVSRGAVKHRN